MLILNIHEIKFEIDKLGQYDRNPRWHNPPIFASYGDGRLNKVIEMKV